MSITAHPGEMIKAAYVEGRGIEPNRIAKCLNVSQSTMCRILNCKQDITPNMSIRLSYVLGHTAEYWLMMQVKHSIAKEGVNFDYSSLEAIES